VTKLAQPVVLETDDKCRPKIHNNSSHLTMKLDDVVRHVWAEILWKFGWMEKLANT